MSFSKKCITFAQNISHIMTKYNIREKTEKQANYRNQINPTIMDELFDQIQIKLIIEKKYRDPDYTAQKLADELGTNSRYISAVVNQRFLTNYSCLVNEYRIREAQYMLIDKRFEKMTIEEISSSVGFANRQSFYAAFFRIHGITPTEFREKKAKFINR